MRGLAALVVCGLVGCGEPSRDALVVVEVEGRLPGVRQLRVRATDQAARPAREIVYPADPPAIDLVPPQRLGLRTAAGSRGTLAIEVAALDAAGSVLEEHRVDGVVFAPGETVRVPVCFGGGAGCRPDGGVPDAGPGPDGALPDGAPPLDGAPQLPVTNGQPGDLFLGQPDGTSATANNGGRSAHSLSLPSGGAAAGGRLWVVDQLNRRTLQWNAPPATNADADLVIGQMNGTLATQGLSYQLMPSPSRVSGSANRLAISDPGSNRVLLWTNLPAGNFGPASWVLGQNGSTTTTAGKGASQLEGPEGVWTDGDRVVVADSRNSRVLIWNAWPTQNGAPASLVIGRPAFGIGAGDGVPPASATSMNGAIDAWSDGTRLYVCDFNNNRVLVWRSFPTTNGQAADYVIGQSGPNAGSANAGQAGVNAAGLDGPIAVVGGRGSLFIADLANLRVVVHTPTPTTSGEAADAVLGQTDLVSRVITNLNAPVPSRIHAPAALGLDGAFLWVVDADWNRVGRYALRP